MSAITLSDHFARAVWIGADAARDEGESSRSVRPRLDVDAAFLSTIRDGVRQVARDLLFTRYGVPQDGRHRMFPTAGDVLRGESTEAVWTMAGARRVTTTTLNVLMTNILESQTVPHGVGLDIFSDYENLWSLTDITTDDLRAFDLRGHSADGATYPLLPEQVALMVALARGPSLSKMEFRSRDSTDVIEMSPPDGPHASFSWVVSTMGSGKTTMVLNAACFHVQDGWDACRSNFDTWRQNPVNGYASVRPGNAEQLARAVVVVAPAHLYQQWRSHIQRDKPNIALVQVVSAPPVFATEDSLATKLVHALRDAGASPDAPRIILCTVDTFVRAFCRLDASGITRTHKNCKIGAAALVMDELAVWANYCHGTSRTYVRDALSIPFLTAYRMYGITATPVRALTEEMVKMNATTFFKNLFFSDPNIRTLRLQGQDAKSLARERDTWRLFCAYNPAPELQISASRAATRFMPTHVQFENVMLPFNMTFNAFFNAEKASRTNESASLPMMRNAHLYGTTWPKLSLQVGQNHSTLEDIVDRHTYMSYAAALASPMWYAASVVRDLAPLCTDQARVAEATNEVQTRWIASNDRDVMMNRMLRSAVRDAVAYGMCAVCHSTFSTASTTHGNACCGSLMCNACIQIHGAQTIQAQEGARTQCAVCTFPSPDVKQLDPATLSLRDIAIERPTFAAALRHVLKVLLADGRRKILIFCNAHAGNSLAAWNRAAFGLQMQLFASVNVPHAVRDMKQCAIPSACRIVDDASNFELSGLDLGFCDAIIALGKLKNDQQAFSRALRMSAVPSAQQRDLRIVRVDFETPRLTLRVGIENVTTIAIHHVPSLTSKSDVSLAFSVIEVDKPKNTTRLRLTFTSANWSDGGALLDLPKTGDASTCTAALEYHHNNAWMPYIIRTDRVRREIIAALEARARNLVSNVKDALVEVGDGAGPSAIAAVTAVAVPPVVPPSTQPPPAYNNFIADVSDACVLGVEMFEDALRREQNADEDEHENMNAYNLNFIKPKDISFLFVPAILDNAAYSEVEVSLPPIASIETNRTFRMTFIFKERIVCDCVPDDADALQIELDGANVLHAEWMRSRDRAPATIAPLTRARNVRIALVVPHGDNAHTLSTTAVFDE